MAISPNSMSLVLIKALKTFPAFSFEY